MGPGWHPGPARPVPAGTGVGGAGRGMRVAQALVFRGGPFAESTEGRQ